jgi:hypothetical protein
MLQATTTATYVSAIDDQANSYLARIRQIDKILEGPVKTLIGLTQQQEKRDGETVLINKVHFPTWISSELHPPEDEDNRLTQALCCGTLQQISRFRRRFSWLDKDSMEQLTAIRKELVKAFMPEDSRDFKECVTLLSSQTFGGLNPLTASHIFRVLLDEGERAAHSGIGFLAFFAMIWPLSRQFPVRLTAGARIEPWEVTAYATAKCLLPIRRLQEIIEQRAELYDQIARNLSNLSKTKKGTTPRDRWLFKIELDNLSANVSLLSRLAINKKACDTCANSIVRLSNSEDLDNDKIYDKVLENLSAALTAIKQTSAIVLNDANNIVNCLDKAIVGQLRVKGRELKNQEGLVAEDAKCGEPLPALKEDLQLRFAEEHANNIEYWDDLAGAAKKSVEYCREALIELETACKISPELNTAEKDSPNLETRIKSALRQLGNANRNVKDVLNKPVKNAALWCRNVVDREIAHASAENFTDFDPSELVSGIAVAVGWDLMSTKLQVSDAVTKAIAGARKDGSWRSGKPYYSCDHASGIWAMTSDIVWTLTSAIKQFPAVNEADEELFNFVDWLERTQISLPAKTPDIFTQSRAKQSTTEQSEPRKQLLDTYVGWPSERLRDRGKIQPGTTALSINALLEIRNLVEYRLWELCNKRFTVLSSDKPLREIAPVDLGAAHPKRLHRTLGWVAYRARMNRPEAEFSLVLHGPPGSSKTKLAEALSAEMWKLSNKWGPNEPRLIRITPADFTRMGEDRLDSEARAIFDLLSGVRAVTIFFDEIDDLLRQRSTNKDRPTFMQLVVPAMLNRLADLRSACPRQEICFILATNYVDHIDSALIRKGRIDKSLPVVYPDFVSRVALSIGETEKNLKKSEYKELETRKKEVSDLLNDQHENIAKATRGWPYLTLTSLCGFLVRKLMEEKWDFNALLRVGVARYGSSFSPPLYDGERLKTQSQEFLNEYIHHIISQFKEHAECKDYLETQITHLSIDQSVADKLREMLDTAFDNERRPS